MISCVFRNLKIGDIVMMLKAGCNQYKKGIVREIDRERLVGDPRWKGSVYVEPIDCEFIFARNPNRFKNGLVHLFKDEIRKV